MGLQLLFKTTSGLSGALLAGAVLQLLPLALAMTLPILDPVVKTAFQSLWLVRLMFKLLHQCMRHRACVAMCNQPHATLALDWMRRCISATWRMMPTRSTY